MSGIILKELPFPVDTFAYAQNGMVPDVRFYNRIANAQNHILAFRTKHVFADWDNTHSGSGTTKVLHRFRFHAGYGAQFLMLQSAMGYGGHPTTTAYATFSISVAGSGSYATQTVKYGQAQNGATDAPDEIQWSKCAFALTPNTTYEVFASVDNEARLVSLAAWTTGIATPNTSTNYYVYPSSTYGQIDDASRQRFTQGLSEIWKRNGAHLLNWSCGGTPKTTTGATWTNPTDATTAVAATSAGYILGSSLLTPYTRRVQPLKAVLAVYARVTGGAGTGEVRLYSDSGSGAPTFAAITGIGATAQWYSLEQTVPSGGDALSAFSKVDLQHRMNGAGTMNLHAVSLYLYET